MTSTTDASATSDKASMSAKASTGRDGSGAARAFRLPMPRSIAGQIAMLLVAAIVLTHLLVSLVFLFMGPPPWRYSDHPIASANRLAAILRLVEAAPDDRRRDIVALAKITEPALALSWAAERPAIGPAGSVRTDPPYVTHLRLILGPTYEVASQTVRGSGEEEAMRVAVTTQGGLTLSGEIPDRPLSLQRWAPIFGTVVFLALTLTALSVWVTRALAAPLGRLAEAAEAFGIVEDTGALPSRGPEEVLTVSRALGRMRDRVRRLIDDRTRMLAAISHDLRTPITRMRLRAEFIEDETVRATMLRDLAQMSALVEAALSFVRDGHTRERVGPLDLASLVQTVCDEFADGGADVEAETLRHVLVTGRADELQRALTNLIDNAVKYGTTVRVRMHATQTGATIAIADQGPGIPAAEQAAMLQPFVRGDRARNLDDAPGFGLGLSIALAIVEAHGGRLELADGDPSGLVVSLHLPRAAGAAATAPATWTSAAAAAPP